MLKETLTVELTEDELEAMLAIARITKRQYFSFRLQEQAELVLEFIARCEDLLKEQIWWWEEGWE